MSQISLELPEGVRRVDERLIRVTDSAVVKLEALKEREKSGDFLRIRVTGGGCSGLSYKLNFVPAAKAGDLFIERGEALILVDSKSALYLKGMTLDYSDNMIAGGFKFNNPNAKASCSCGESFAV